MRAAYLQLLGASVAMKFGPLIYFSFSLSVDIEIASELEIQNLKTEYAEAYGSSGIRGMVVFFVAELAESEPETEAVQLLYLHFVAVLRQMLDEFKRIKLVLRET